MEILLKDKKLVVKIDGVEQEYKITNIPIRNQREWIFPVLNDICKDSTFVRNKFKKCYVNYVKTRDESELYKNFLELKWSLYEYYTTKQYFKKVQEIEIIQKSRKKQIFFSTEEMVEVLIGSFYLKFYALFYATELRPSRVMHNKIFSNLLQNLSKHKILAKIYKLIQVKVFASSTSNKAFWAYLRFVTGDSPETVCIETYVNILENVLPVLSKDLNPITYIVVYARNVVEYIFVSAYNDCFFYSSMFYYDLTESQQKQPQQLLPTTVVKHLVEKTITPLVNQRFILDIEVSKNIVEPNPLTDIIAIPFFAKLTGTRVGLYRSLNLHYLHTISLYVSIALSYMEYKQLSKLLTCGIIREKKTTKPRISTKNIKEMLTCMDPALAKVAYEQKLFHKLTEPLRNCTFIDLKTGEPVVMNENTLIEEITMFLKTFYAGKFAYTFDKLQENGLNCFCL